MGPSYVPCRSRPCSITEHKHHHPIINKPPETEQIVKKYVYKDNVGDGVILGKLGTHLHRYKPDNGESYTEECNAEDCPYPKEESLFEKVNHPSHYTSHPTGVECIDIIEVMPLNIGNAMKYLWRTGLKQGVDPIEDLKKAEWYIKREIARRESKSSKA